MACCTGYSFGQQQIHETSAGYDKPTEALVNENLDQWQDLKFGLFMHWGTYSQWGVIESWTLCPEDWIDRKPEHGKTYFDYVTNYENLQKTFNPTDFNPKKWADAAKAAGMKYVVFTTKHHDGFAMYDTKESDYKITSPNTPFSSNPKADVTKEIFNTFRTDGFKIGAYFSKPDWHSDYYWWRYFPPKDRNVNYETKKYPERWEKFKNFTYNQINELTSNYGKVDILWLDGGQVRPSETNNQDIDMDRIGGMARKNQPGIIVVDRTVPGKWENYVTPEQAIPERPLDKPWESCITMGDSFSYVPNDKYKSSKTIVETLIRIISRGGNYLLNIAPGPKGDFDQVAYDRLKDLADWMKINGSAVFATRTIAPFHQGDYYYTRSKDNKEINVFHLSEGDVYQKPVEYVFEVPENFKVGQLHILGHKGKLKWSQQGNQVHVQRPATDLKYAATIQLHSK
jgi:alpha-L-fucosidase